MKLLFSTAILAFLFLQSCTVVTSTNLPGKPEKEIPKFMRGTFELIYPGDLAALNEEGKNAKVKIEKTRLSITTEEGTNESTLNDSLFITKLGSSYYLAMGAAPDYSVFKIVKSGKNIELYSMFSQETSSIESFEPYFSNVTEIPGEPDEETGEPGLPSFKVTIDESKIDSYFASDIPMKEPFLLKKK